MHKRLPDSEFRIRPAVGYSIRITTIVTAADRAYARSLGQMLLSVERHGHRDVVVVFDLGLSERDRRRLARRFPSVRLVRFDFGAHPAHVARLELCAWKPVAIDETIRRQGGSILWLDAATIIHAALEEVFAAIARDGVLTLVGQSPVVRWCHARTLDLMNVPEEDRRKRCRIGGVVGFDGDNAVVRRLVATWREAALNAEILDPPGARRDNHRWDQALLTNVLYAFERQHGLVLRDDEADISSMRPVRWVSTRNKVATWIPLAADPLVRVFYATSKQLDRVLLRVRYRKSR
jgi:hypothetical protein